MNFGTQLGKLTCRSELPSFCFPDGQPPKKKKGKRAQQEKVGVAVAEGAEEGQTGSRQAGESAGEITDEQGPSKRSKAEPGPDGAVPVPTATGADPARNDASAAADVKPPPGLEGVPAPSDAAKAAYASAANGVASDPSQNADGKVVLNGA